MNYIRVYWSIIHNRLHNKVDGYVEHHHIIPRSEGGPDNNDNIVSLTAREHYICHLLLAKIYNDDKMWYAVNIMSRLKNKIKITSRIYEIIKTHLAKVMSDRMTGRSSWNKGKRLSTETIAKISKSLTGKKQSDETKAKRSAKLKGHSNWGPKHHTDETKKLISDRVKANLPDTVFKPGHTTWNKGIPMAADSKEKMRKKLIGRKNGPRSEETKEKIRLAKIGKHHSKETRLKLSKRVVQYTKDFVFVKEWESVKAAAEALGSSKIGTVCNGHREFAAGFRWFFKEDLCYFF